jgi:uncharacterized protein RhaS with RHS repeats
MMTIRQITGFMTDKVSSDATDANGHVKRYSYDGQGNLSIVTEFVPGAEYRTRYAYDVLNNLKLVADALGNSTVITYDVPLLPHRVRAGGHGKASSNRQQISGC